MATMNYAAQGAAQMAQRAMPGHKNAPAPVSNAPPGTFVPGTKVQVGSHRVVIEKYLSEGGFAHVYVVRVPTKDGKYEVAVLKRVAVPDKEALANMRTEVETMKKLQGHIHIVRYIDSHASQLKGGGYEVFLLMEYCAGGGLIDFMNTRLQYRLTEPEILHIFSDVAEGVATMHYLKPPLLHRDLKVENVLISKPPSSGGNVLYKLCDFGSSAVPRPAAGNAAEARLIEDDVQRHTTMQYRSPEMIDVWRKQPIDEKSDIWALGVLLYKLCYYTTPFEEVGQMAILNAKFKFPHHPHFSERLRKLISAMLKEDPKQRPNIYQVVQEVCSMRNKSIPIKDIYTNRSRSEDVKNQRLPPSSPQINSPPPASVGISHSPPKQSAETIPDITPMRRGRPTAPTQQAHPAKPSPSPVKGDPFAALDSSNYNVRAGAVDELSKKFPSLDEFSITMDQKPGFDFSTAKSNPAAQQARAAGSMVADRARAGASGGEVAAIAEENKSLPSARSTVRELEKVASNPEPQRPTIAQPVPKKSTYVSTGTMTSSTPPPVSKTNYAVSNKPIWRVPSHSRAESLPRPTSVTNEQKQATATTRSLQPSPRPEMQGTKSPALDTRPPLESAQSFGQSGSGLSRTRSVNATSRPSSSAYVGSNLDYLRDHEETVSKSPPALGSRRSSRQQLPTAASPEESRPIRNDTAYLRSLEESEDSWQKQQLNSMSLRSKRASMPPVKLSAETTNLFDRHSPANDAGPTRAPGRSSPSRDLFSADRPLSPVAASEATSASPRPTLIDVSGLDEVEDMPPEMRREMERQLAIQEEKRVAEAAAAYRSTSGGPQAPGRASTIQQRMQSLMDEGRQSPVKRTAAGYGHYTDISPDEKPAPVRKAVPEVTRVISPTDYTQGRASPKPQQELEVGKQRRELPAKTTAAQVPVSASAPPTSNKIAPPKPSAKPKPVGLRSGFTGQKSSQPQSPVKTQDGATAEWRSAANTTSQGSRLAALLAKDQEGVAEAGPGLKPLSDIPPELEDTTSIPSAGEGKDWELEFSKRYPSLSGIEMVETEIGGLSGGASQRELRIKDV